MLFILRRLSAMGVIAAGVLSVAACGSSSSSSATKPAPQ